MGANFHASHINSFYSFQDPLFSLVCRNIRHLSIVQNPPCPLSRQPSFINQEYFRCGDNSSLKNALPGDNPSSNQWDGNDRVDPVSIMSNITAYNFTFCSTEWQHGSKRENELGKDSQQHKSNCTIVHSVICMQSYSNLNNNVPFDVKPFEYYNIATYIILQCSYIDESFKLYKLPQGHGQVI